MGSLIEGDRLDMKLFAAVMALSVVLAGAVYAMPGMHGMRGWPRNETSASAFHMRNGTFANSTEVQEFGQAVASGDYATAKSLHDSYGLGGPLFDRLDAVTFVEYSQIYNLQAQLHDLERKLFSDLGFAAGTRPQGYGGMGPMHGMGGFRGIPWPHPPPANSS
jgi:hypothetical protein